MTIGQPESRFKALIVSLSKQFAKSRHWIIAFVMLMCYVALVTVASQTASLALQQSVHFKAPFLFIFFKMLFRTVAFPMWLMVNALTKLCQGQKVVLVDIWRHCEDICGQNGLWTWRALIFKFTPTALTMLLMQIGYTLGLTYLSTSMSTALYCSAVAISYGLTWVFFKRPLLLIKSIFVLMSFAGVGLIAYANFGVKIDLTKTIIGIIASIFAALCLPLHQIAFMKAFPMGDLGQVSFALSGMNILICLIYWPVPLAMYLTGYEVYDITAIPAGLVIVSWICTGISSTTAGYGLVLSSPFFMSIGELLILAANSVLDVTVRHLIMSRNQMIGTILIGIAFLVLVIPDAYISITCCFNDNDDEEDLESPKELCEIPTIDGAPRRDSVAPSRRKSSFGVRRTATSGRRRSSAIVLAARRMSAATGETTDAEGKQISYEFYPSSEPCMVLSTLEDALPVGLPEARVNLAEGARRMSLGVRRMSAAAGRRVSMAARKMSTMPESNEEVGAEQSTGSELDSGFHKSKSVDRQLLSLDEEEEHVKPMSTARAGVTFAEV